MKYIHNMKPFFVLTLMAAALVACTRNEQPVTTTEEEPVPTVSRMVLTGGITLWDVTKGDPVDWVDGQAIYIGLSNGTTIKKVVARYYASESEENRWRLTYDGSLSDFSSGDCKCYYVVDNNYANDFITLNYNSVVYADEKAKFSIVDNSLQVSANLTPFTGRIKFVYPQYGDRSRYYLAIAGLSYYSQLDLSTFQFKTSNNAIQYDLRSTTDTYVYAQFANQEGKIVVWDRNNENYIYTRNFNSEILEPGRSNWLYWPTNDYHNEWKTSNFYMDFDDQSFRYVIPGTFEMGGNDAQPIHKVTLTKPFYICRHEVRQTTWTQVTGDSYDPTVWSNEYDYPAFGKSWEQVNSFIQKMNAKYSEQGYRFRLPTEAEWEYCAKSGIYNYTSKYASTDEINYIVWDGVTATPDNIWSWYNNGLGLYNACGNVSEWVSDYYADYPNEDVINPQTTTGEKHIKRGGARNSPDAKFLTVTYRDAEESDNSMAGVRLVLEVNQ